MKIYQVNSDKDKIHFRELSIEYVAWVIEEMKVFYEVEAIEAVGDVAEYVDQSMQSLGKFMPPQGHLLLYEIDGEVAGMGGMRQLADSICEIKRIYVRPKFRGNGIARTMLGKLLAFAKEKEYPTVYLESGGFMKAAHGLYRSFGFEERGPYEGAEVPEEFHERWLFFELDLSNSAQAPIII